MPDDCTERRNAQTPEQKHIGDELLVLLASPQDLPRMHLRQMASIAAAALVEVRRMIVRLLPLGGQDVPLRLLRGWSGDKGVGGSRADAGRGIHRLLTEVHVYRQRYPDNRVLRSRGGVGAVSLCASAGGTALPTTRSPCARALRHLPERGARTDHVFYAVTYRYPGTAVRCGAFVRPPPMGHQAPKTVPNTERDRPRRAPGCQNQNRAKP